MRKRIARFDDLVSSLLFPVLIAREAG